MSSSLDLDGVTVDLGKGGKIVGTTIQNPSGTSSISLLDSEMTLSGSSVCVATGETLYVDSISSHTASKLILVSGDGSKVELVGGLDMKQEPIVTASLV